MLSIVLVIPSSLGPLIVAVIGVLERTLCGFNTDGGPHGAARLSMCGLYTDCRPRQKHVVLTMFINRDVEHAALARRKREHSKQSAAACFRSSFLPSRALRASISRGPAHAQRD